MLVSKYPKNLKITTKQLTNIYASHRMNNIDPNFAILTLTDTKIISFYSGLGENVIIEPDHIVALILRRDEKPLKFKATLKDAAAKILSSLKEEKYNELFPTIFKEITKIS
ncbi:MAG: hypothetical protein ACFFCM_06390 [Promethearchaeota archaeon]